jgi:hypothetical protein
MRLAWYNIAHDRTRFLVTVLGITCAVFLMIFQGSILLGFLQASSKIIDATDADLWITGRGVQCFEFPVSVEIPVGFVPAWCNSEKQTGVISWWLWWARIPTWGGSFQCHMWRATPPQSSLTRW